jgi:hypothetical protein
MIREVETLEATTLRPAIAALSGPSAESVENEINRLTWAVLDGSASPGDRNRLADLVRMQHSHRPRLSA